MREREVQETLLESGAEGMVTLGAVHEWLTALLVEGMDAGTILYTDGSPQSRLRMLRCTRTETP